MEILEFIDSELAPETQMRIAQYDHTYVPKLINPHPTVIAYMVKKNPYLFKKIKNPTKEMRYAAAEANIDSIHTMKDLTDEEKIYYFGLYGCSVLEMIEEPPRVVQEKAIATNKVIHINALHRIDPDLQMNLVKDNPASIAWIQCPTIEAVAHAIHHRPALLPVLWNNIKDIYPIELFPKDTIKKLIDKNVVKEEDGEYRIVKSNKGVIF